MKKITDLIEKEELNMVVKYTEIMRYLIQDLMEDYFSLDPSNAQAIMWDFERNRARAEAISDYLFQLEQEIERLNLTFWTHQKAISYDALKKITKAAERKAAEKPAEVA